MEGEGNSLINKIEKVYRNQKIVSIYTNGNYMIEYNTKNYLNKINGISPKNPKLNIYTEAGNFYLIMKRMFCQMKLYIGQDNRKEREIWEHGDQSYFKMI